MRARARLSPIPGSLGRSPRIYSSPSSPLKTKYDYATELEYVKLVQSVSDELKGACEAS